MQTPHFFIGTTLTTYLLAPPKYPKNKQDYIDLPISGGELYSL